MTAVQPAALLAALVLAGASFLWLRQAGYGRATAMTLAAVTSVQAGVAVAVVQSGHSLWLALGVAAVAASVSALAEQENVRRIILVGGSLAAIQVFDPMGGLVAAGLLPASIALTQGREDRRKAAGLYALLLFMPVITAALLLYLSRGLHVGADDLLAARTWLPPGAGLAVRFAPVLGLALVIAPSLCGLRHDGAHSAIVVFVAVAVLAAAIFDAVVGVFREPVTLLAAAAPLTIVALAAWPPRRRGYATIAACLAAGASWAVLFLLVPLPYAGR